MTREVSSRSVYVIGTADAPVKIGMAERPRKRLAELQVGCPDILVLHHAVRVPWGMAPDLEQLTHKAFAERHRHGEWFNVDQAEAVETIKRIRAVLLADQTAWAERHGDLFDQLRASFVIRNDVREAVDHYREKLDADDPYAGHANGYIVKEAGLAAYAAFSVLIAQRAAASTIRGDDRRRMFGLLAKSVNALSDFREAHKRAVWAKESEQIRSGNYSAVRKRAA